MPYLRLLLTAFYRLKPRQETVFRGVNLGLDSLDAKYVEGRRAIWWAVSSTTSRVNRIHAFLGQNAHTNFTISAKYARNIRRFSAIRNEDELVLLPGAKLRVKSVLSPNVKPPSHTVHLVEYDEPMSLVEWILKESKTQVNVYVCLFPYLFAA